jgi:hypothetical protein
MPEKQVRKHCIQLPSTISYLQNVEKVILRDLKLDHIVIEAFKNVEAIDLAITRTVTADKQQLMISCGSPPGLAAHMIWNLGTVLSALAVI